MRSGTKAKLQEILSDYPYFAERIPKLEGKQQALMMERRDAVERVLNKTNSDVLRDAIGIYYFAKPRRYTWQGVAIKCGVHPNYLSKLHMGFLRDLAKELGEI